MLTDRVLKLIISLRYPRALFDSSITSLSNAGILALAFDSVLSDTNTQKSLDLIYYVGGPIMEIIKGYFGIAKSKATTELHK